MKQEIGYSESKAKTKGRAANRIIFGSSPLGTIKKQDVKSKPAPTTRAAEAEKPKPPDTFTVKSRKPRKGRELKAGEPGRLPKIPVKPNALIGDLEFLDAVRDTVYRKLVNGELELKIDSGFKAIELKNKLSDGSENEKLLLKILSEIRREELNRAKP